VNRPGGDVGGVVVLTLGEVDSGEVAFFSR
jgi:hypothetical protein